MELADIADLVWQQTLTHERHEFEFVEEKATAKNRTFYFVSGKDNAREKWARTCIGWSSRPESAV